MDQLNQFVMETKGYCLLCLKLPHQVRKSEVSVLEDNGIKVKDGGGGGGGTSTSSKICSLQRISHYLKLNRRRIFHDVLALSPTSLPVLEKSELKGVLCVECSKLAGTISDVTLELELLQMNLDSLLRSLHDKMEDVVERNGKVVEEFKREMLSSPQTLLHFGIVEQLRKETLKKSSSKILQAQPRVILKRSNLIYIPTLETSRQPVPTVVDSPELSQSTPVITSVQGSYNGTSSSRFDSTPTSRSSALEHEHVLLMEPTAGTISPRPETPPSIPEEINLADEESDEENPLSSISETMEQVPPPPPVSSHEISYDCKICKRTFRRNRERLDHHLIVHEGHRYMCSLCPATFTGRSSFARHRRKDHSQAEGEMPMKLSKPEAMESSSSSTAVASNPDVPEEPPSTNKVTTEEPQQPETESMEEDDTTEEVTVTPPTPSIPPQPEQTLLLKHRCKICGKGFKRNLLRVDHINTVHRGIKFKCGMCPSTFMYRSGMYTHRRLFHSNGQTNQVGGNTHDNEPKEPLQLQQPPRRPRVRKRKGQPSSSSSPAVPGPSKPFGCPICPKRFSINQHKLDHIKTVHHNCWFQCDLCPSAFMHRASFYRHRKRYHKQTVTHGGVEVEPTPINKNKSKKSSTLMSSDMAALSMESMKFEPAVVDLKPFIRHHHHQSLKSRVTQRMTRKGGSRNFQCKSCSTTFTLRCNLSRHRRKYCPQVQIQNAPTSSQEESAAQQHSFGNDAITIQIGSSERIELNDQPTIDDDGNAQLELQLDEDDEEDSMEYQDPLSFDEDHGGGTAMSSLTPTSTSPSGKSRCHLCGKTFLSESLKSDHLATVHQGLKFKCGMCPSTFMFRSSMHRHRRLLHKNDVLKPTKLEPSSASSQTNSTTEEEHQNIEPVPESQSASIRPTPTPTTSTKTNNKREKNYECPTCHKRFWRELHVLDHEKVVHLQMRFHCDLCPTTFTVRDSLRNHRKRFHKKGVTCGAEFEPKPMNDEGSGTPTPKSSSAAAPPVSTPLPVPLKAIKMESTTTNYSKALKRSKQRLKRERKNRRKKYHCEKCHTGFTLSCSLSRHKRKACRFREDHANPSASEVVDLNEEEVEEQMADLDFLPENDDLHQTVPEEVSSTVRTVEGHNGTSSGASSIITIPLQSGGVRGGVSEQHPSAGTSGSSSGTQQSVIITLPLQSGTRRIMNEEPLEDPLMRFLLGEGLLGPPPPPPPSSLPQRQQPRQDAPVPQPSTPAPLPVLYECQFCKKTFRGNRQRLQHEWTIHQGVKFPCGLCPASFTFKHSMLRHRRKVHSEQSRAAELAQQEIGSSPSSSVNPPQLEETQQTSSNAEPQPQDPLSVDDDDDDENAASKKVPAPSTSSPMTSSDITKNFECRTCHKLFWRDRGRSDHEKIAHGNFKFFCNLCTATFVVRHSLVRHRKQVHNIVQTYGPEMEPQPISNNKNSRIQNEAGSAIATSSEQVVSIPPPPPLPVNLKSIKREPSSSGYSKALQRSKTRLLHGRANRRKPFHCQFCDAGFTVKPSLKKHLETCYHRAKANHQQQISEETLQFQIGSSERIELNFGGTGNLQEFLPEAEDEPASSSSQNQVIVIGESQSLGYPCSECHKQFKSVGSLRHHQTLIHDTRDSERKFGCDLCGKRFMKNYVLTVHRRTVHKIRDG